MILDFAIHSPRQGHPRPIDLYRKAAPPAIPGSNEALMLEAMAGARFALWGIERRHEVAGLVIRDFLREAELWLMDLRLEATADAGGTFAAHLIAPGPYVMTTGVAVPAEGEMLMDVLELMPAAKQSAPMAAMAGDPQFAAFVCRAALAQGAMEQISFA